MVLEGALDVFMLPQQFEDGNTEADGIEDLDPEEATFQASFSKLGASEGRPRDVLSDIADPKRYLSKSLAEASAKHPGKVRMRFDPATGQRMKLKDACVVQYTAFMAVVPKATSEPFVLYMSSQS